MTFEDREDETHPSYGLVGFSRVTASGGNKLFGSHLEHHHDTIYLRIHQAAIKHTYGCDWFMARTPSCIEVELSPAQFATLLTTMNIGDGVPCTIRRLNGQSVEEVPYEHTTEQNRTREDYALTVKDLLKSIPVKRAELDRILDSSKMTKKDKKAVKDAVHHIFMFFESNADFALEQFTEAADKVVVEAKAQVEEFVTSTLSKLGMEALREKFGHVGLFTGKTKEGE